MSKHTPGPWEVHLGYDNTGYPCFYIHGMSGDQKRDIPTLTANAKLIAAAPELKDALAELLAAELAIFPSAEAGKEAQDAWADRRAAARNNASALIARVS